MKISYFNVLRFYAAIVILIFHTHRLPNELNGINTYIFQNGSLYVIMFFILSGFLYNHKNIKYHKEVIPKVLRIYIPYTIGFLIILMSQFEVSNIFIYLTMSQSYFPGLELINNSPSWFLSSMLLFILSAPYLNKLLKRNHEIFIFIIIFMWINIIYIIPQIQMNSELLINIISYNPIFQLHYFMGGMLLREYMYDTSKPMVNMILNLLFVMIFIVLSIFIPNYDYTLRAVLFGELSLQQQILASYLINF